jgi:hypothetical protein
MVLQAGSHNWIALRLKPTLHPDAGESDLCREYELLGVANPKENQLPFVFKDERREVSFTNDFVYDAKTNTRGWHLDNIANGAAKPFGRVKTYSQLIFQCPSHWLATD